MKVEILFFLIYNWILRIKRMILCVSRMIDLWSLIVDNYFQLAFINMHCLHWWKRGLVSFACLCICLFLQDHEILLIFYLCNYEHILRLSRTSVGRIWVRSLDLFFALLQSCPWCSLVTKNFSVSKFAGWNRSINRQCPKKVSNKLLLDW